MSTFARQQPANSSNVTFGSVGHVAAESVSATWNATTGTNNLLLAAIAWQEGANVTDLTPNDAAWTLVSHATGGTNGVGVSLYYIYGHSPRSGAETFTFGATPAPGGDCIIGLFEYAGALFASDPLEGASVNKANGTGTALTSATCTIAQAGTTHELVFAMMANASDTTQGTFGKSGTAAGSVIANPIANLSGVAGSSSANRTNLYCSDFEASGNGTVIFNSTLAASKKWDTIVAGFKGYASTAFSLVQASDTDRGGTITIAAPHLAFTHGTETDRATAMSFHTTQTGLSPPGKRYGASWPNRRSRR